MTCSWICFGKESGESNKSGSENAFFGKEAGRNNTDGNQNDAIGSLAGFNETVMVQNVYLGYQAGASAIALARSGNVFIGANSGRNETGSDKLYIQNTLGDETDALIYGDFHKDILSLNGMVGISNLSPNDALDVIGDVDATGCFQTNDSGVVGGLCVSDKRLKENIKYFNGSLEKISKLNPARYDWRKDLFSFSKQHGSSVGLIAQEVEEVFPHLIETQENGYKKVHYNLELQMHMIQAIKELKFKNDDLAKENDSLKSQLSIFEDRLVKLESTSRKK